MQSRLLSHARMSAAAFGAAVLTTAAHAQTAAAENPYGLSALWAQSDLVAKAVLLILVLMSAGSWYVIVTKLLAQLRVLRQGREAGKQFNAEGSVRERADKLNTNSPFRYVADAGLQATGRHAKLARHVTLNDWVTLGIQRAIERFQATQQRGLSFLATVGATAPFVGLFGTVWGIYHALTAIGVSGQASIDKVAGPVGEALIMTAIGLAVAVPAVLGYNWLARRNKATLDEVRAFGNELHAELLAQTPAPAPAHLSVQPPVPSTGPHVLKQLAA